MAGVIEAGNDAGGRLQSWPGTDHPHRELIGHLTRTTSLTPGESARVVADVLGYFGEPADGYVRRRHRELKALGLTNDQVFRLIAEELPQRLVAPPRLSRRQLRRIVYG